MKETGRTFFSGGFKSKYIEISKTLQAYQVAVDQVAIVSVTDLAGKIIYVNKKFSEISKYSPDELIGKTHSIINSGYHPDNFFKEMWQTISQGKAWRGEIKNKAKDGTYYWVDTVITPVKDKNENIFQYLSIRNLITIQKEHEEKLINFQKVLLKREEQLKDAQSVAKTGSWHLDIGNNSLEWSEETYRIFEISPDNPMTYESFLEAVHPDDRQRVHESWQAALKKGSYEIEHRIITPSGEKWVSERARIEFDPSSVLSKALGTVQDITEKKKTENVLKESEELYKNLFNHSPFAIGILDKNNLRFLEVNQTASKLYGYSIEEFKKLTAYDIRIPEEHDKLTDQIEKGVYTSDKSARLHRKKNGDIIRIEPTITEIFYKDRQAFLITINDITEKLKIEQELARAKKNRQKELHRATIEAEEKSRTEIGRELHDNINQLLVASTLFIKKTKPATEEDNEFLNTGVDIVSKAIEEIRKLSFQFVPPSLHDLSLKESIEYLAQNFSLSGTSFKFDIAMNESILEPSLKINIYRIIQEQFNNITKYASATRVMVRIKQKPGSLTLEITDNGKGFDQKQKLKSIGLVNIFQRAEAYNGKTSIETSPGNGCKVYVDFALGFPPQDTAIKQN